VAATDLSWRWWWRWRAVDGLLVLFEFCAIVVWVLRSRCWFSRVLQWFVVSVDFVLAVLLLLRRCLGVYSGDGRYFTHFFVVVDGSGDW
jgi:hypothetical protein